MESIRDICNLARPGDWAFSLDFEKGFQQVPLKAEFTQFCLFQLDGVCYSWSVLLQGQYKKDFSYIVRCILKRDRRCCFDIDDVIVLATSMAEAICRASVVSTQIPASLPTTTSRTWGKSLATTGSPAAMYWKSLLGSEYR